MVVFKFQQVPLPKEDVVDFKIIQTTSRPLSHCSTVLRAFKASTTELCLVITGILALPRTQLSLTLIHWLAQASTAFHVTFEVWFPTEIPQYILNLSSPLPHNLSISIIKKTLLFVLTLC